MTNGLYIRFIQIDMDIFIVSALKPRRKSIKETNLQIDLSQKVIQVTVLEQL